MARFYLPASEWSAPVWELRGDEAHHAAKVLRLKQGDSCTVFDGCGRAVHAVVTQPPRSSGVLLTPGAACPPSPAVAHLTLCQSIPKGSNMDLIIQKAVELGVSAIIPLMTDRTIVRLNAREAEAKRQKWQRIALEACKQCGQNTLPEVALPVPFAEWLRQGVPDGLNVIASLAPGVRPARDVLEEARSRYARKASLLVGPEGDFTDRETALALEAGFAPVTLGPIVLRVETAAFFGLAAMRYALD